MKSCMEESWMIKSSIWLTCISLVPIMKIFLLKEKTSEENLVHLNFYSYVEIWYFGALPCIALFRCTCLLCALEMCPIFFIYESQIHLHAGRLSPEYLWLKTKNSSTLQQHFDVTREIFIPIVMIFPAMNRILSYLDTYSEKEYWFSIRFVSYVQSENMRSSLVVSQYLCVDQSRQNLQEWQQEMQKQVQLRVLSATLHMALTEPYATKTCRAHYRRFS